MPRVSSERTLGFVLRHVFESRRNSSSGRRICFGSCCAGITADNEFRPSSMSVLFSASSKRPVQRLASGSHRSGRGSIFAFLQERWPVFLDSLAKDLWLVRLRRNTASSSRGRRFCLSTMTMFAFTSTTAEGLLKPVPHQHSQALAKTWVAQGVKVSRAESSPAYRRLLDSVEKTIPAAESVMKNGSVSPTDGPSSSPWAGSGGYSARNSGAPRCVKISARFCAHRLGSGASRPVNLPPVPPVMLHHIPRYLARSLGDDRRTKIAFLLVDGLALDQWIALRDVLGELDSKLWFRENVFRRVPTDHLGFPAGRLCRQTADLASRRAFILRTGESWTQFWVIGG